ncbi:MAG TPA: phosphoenolpyruvate--protein phosphotransferase [Geminicoccaceae bacterium]|nr:phosphoenolpyruvate--protein phosphotransferase [Geminicoccaceae bacterium]
MTPGVPGAGGWGGHAGAPAARHSAAGTSAARLLLRRLVEVMAEPVSPQERLDRIVRMIARDIVAEVCSVYVLRPGEVLELFATEGLRPSAVHQTRLRIGQGLVGLIAAQGRVINLPDAQSHPNFVYRPETGEEAYHSFLGVPIAPGGRVAGVLVVQNRARRHYTEEEVEALQIVGTVLAQMLAAGTLVDVAGYPTDIVGRMMGPRRLEGTRLVEGVATGSAVLHRPRIEVSRLLADDPEAETRRLEEAVAGLRDSVDELLALPEIAGGEQRDVLEAYRMFANDAGWLRRMREAIRTGLSAEAAVKRVQEETRLRMGQVSDSYLRERLLDLDSLADRLLRQLVGAAARGHDPAELPEAFVLVARGLGPAELLEYDRGRLQGVILEEGSPTAHVTIIARALDIPMLGRVEGALSAIAPGDRVALDGDHGQVYVRPSEDVEQAFSHSLRVRAERRRRYAALRDRPAVTRDGMRVSLYLNAAFLVDLPHLDATGADGIGLYRTELAFMVRDCHPDVGDQTELYRKVLEHAGGRPVVFRTLDVGGDKHLPYWHFPHEDNPAMGWRAIRMALDRPAVLRGQLRALVRAAAGRTLSVMFPMVAEVAEFDAARRLLDMELERARAAGRAPPRAVRVGTMLEVPALFWQLPALLRRIDFLAIGSNDLMQFLFACDRGNPRLTDRYDVLSPPVLSFLRELVQRCREAGVQLSVCGEMASRPLEAMVLVGLGLRHLSVSPSDVGPVKTMLTSLSCARLSGYLAQLYDLPDHSVRARLRNYAKDHGVCLYTEDFMAA